jgi:hypothetical protein
VIPRPHPQSIVALAFGLVTVACGGRSGSEAPVPSDPVAAVRAFMEAVHENSLATMGQLWGSTTRGPSVDYMDHATLEQRLTVIKTYLAHEEFEILPPDANSLLPEGQRQVRVRITRMGCTPVVPFTLGRWKSGWLISNIDLGAAGNPARPCPVGGGQR